MSAAPADAASDAAALTEFDRYLFNQGTHSALYHRLGAHPLAGNGPPSTRFAVWAPNAETVSVVGDFNDWTPGRAPLAPLGASGVFEGSVEGVAVGARYKFHVRSKFRAYEVDKADPFAFSAELPPATASKVTDLAYAWHDRDWMAQRSPKFAGGAPVSIYELHLGSWGRVAPVSGRFPTYDELAGPLIDYVHDLGFTHVEFLPVMEHPFYPSWGYEPTGLFAPTARYGPPQGLMGLIDALHTSGIGVVLDWVPAHFPTDQHGLGYFDGTHLYEHRDPRRGYQNDWNTYVYNFGRREVRCFLASSAAFWLDLYHADALRFDGVSSMLYRDFARAPGQWVPGPTGGRDDEEAVSLLKWINEVLYARFPGIQTIAEESSSWSGVSHPTFAGGLGFGYKWDLGWMHDVLDYLAHDPVHRRWEHQHLTFRSMYSLSENFVLPLSHDEVVHGKGSLLARMPGDPWQQFANLRLLFGEMFATPGKKLLFMGDEFGQGREWDVDRPVDWGQLEVAWHAGVQAWVRDLNRLYAATPALFALDYSGDGFAWLDADDAAESVLTFVRKGPEPRERVLVALNMTPVPRPGFRIGAPVAGRWRVLANSDLRKYGGSGAEPMSPVPTGPVPWQGQEQSILVDLPPLAAVYLEPEVQA